MTTINLATFVVRNDESGEMDIDATDAKFHAVLVKYQAERETEAETVSTAVNAVFDQYKGATINMPALTHRALIVLNAQNENHKTLTERIQHYVRDNNGKREDGATFAIVKGYGGGVRRWADYVEKSAK